MDTGPVQPALGGAGDVPQVIDTWKYRRRVVVVANIFLIAVITYLVGWGNPDNRLHDMALGDFIWAYVSVVGIYIGAPIADTWLQSRGKRIT